MKSKNSGQIDQVEVVVIGPEPPCVRCLNLHRFAKDAATQFPNKDITVRKIFSHTEEAAQYGRVEGGHTIAEREQVQADGQRMQRLMSEVAELEVKANEGAIEAKLGEIDEALTPVRKRAEEVGSLMTPVLVINGKVKSSGYVPRREQIKEWIEGELRGE
jgi:hypothetical protein